MSEAEIVKRLERLERDNRRLKRIALAAVVLLGSAVALGAARPRSAVPQKIVAHEFDVVNGSGNVRATLGSVSGEPFLRFTGENKQSLLEGPGLIMLVSGGREGLSSVEIGAAHGSPLISLIGGKGFEMDLGSTNTVTPATGQTQRTSAASIVMFGNDKKHHVIWEAPQ